MTEQNQNLNQNNVSLSPGVPGQTLAQPSKLKQILQNARPVFMSLFNGFYLNKKVFWPVSSAIGLVLLVIFLGLLFGKRTGQKSSVILPPSTPIIQNTPQASASGNIIIDSQVKLSDLKNQINNLDVKEGRLQPPTLNFKIKF